MQRSYSFFIYECPFLGNGVGPTVKGKIWGQYHQLCLTVPVINFSTHWIHRAAVTSFRTAFNTFHFIPSNVLTERPGYEGSNPLFILVVMFQGGRDHEKLPGIPSTNRQTGKPYTHFL